MYDDDEVNVYDYPENFGLTAVGSIDWSNEDYRFNFTMVWKDEQGQYWIGTDSGCSCPRPFENYKSVSDLHGPFDSQGASSNLHLKVLHYSNDPANFYGDRSRAELEKDYSDLVARL